MWSVFSMLDPFMKVLEAILAVCGLILQSRSKARRVLLKNEKFGFCFFKDWEWLGWAATGKILIFSRFLAHSITCLLLKNVVLGHFWPFWGLVFLEFLRWGRVDQFSILWFVSILYIICQLFRPFIQKRIRQTPHRNEKMWFFTSKRSSIGDSPSFSKDL